MVSLGALSPSLEDQWGFPRVDMYLSSKGWVRSDPVERVKEKYSSYKKQKEHDVSEQPWSTECERRDNDENVETGSVS